MAINFDAHATLYRWEEVEKQNPNDSDQFGSVQIWDGTLEGCIKVSSKIRSSACSIRYHGG